METIRGGADADDGGKTHKGRKSQGLKRKTRGKYKIKQEMGKRDMT